MPEGKEAERVHRAREAERRRKQEEVRLALPNPSQLDAPLWRGSCARKQFT